MDGFTAKINAAIEAAKEEERAATWTDVGSFADVKWNFAKGDIKGFVEAISGVLLPLNDVLELLLMGEGKYLNVLGIVSIAGGDGYDYAIIPLLEAFGLAADEVKTEVAYKQAVADDKINLLGYILGKVADFAEELLASPVDGLLSILPNLAYFLSNEGLLLTVKNLLAPIYDVIKLLLPILGIDIESFLRIEELLHNIDLGIVIAGVEYGFHIPVIDWLEFAQYGAKEIKEVATSRSNPGNAPNASTWANSFKENVLASPLDENNPDASLHYAKYLELHDDALTNKDHFKNTQTAVLADKGDTLTYLLTWVLDMFGEESNREALVQFLVDFFDLQAGAETTVRYAVNELFNQADAYGASDMLVGSLFAALGVGIQLEAALMGDIATLQQIYKDLFKALGDGSGCAYGSIAKVMEDLTGVWEETVGSDKEHEDATQEAEETLNWFQKIIKKIKEFFNKIFGIFK